MYTQVIFVALFGAVLVNAAGVTKEGPPKVGLPGPCPEYQGLANFDKKKAEGVWYAIEKTPLKDGEPLPTCVKGVCSTAPDGTTTMTISFNKAGDTKRHTKNGTVTLVPGKQGVYKLTLVHAPGDASHSDHSEETFEKTITILDSDYDNYSFEVGCKSFDGQHKLGGALWSRQPTLSAENIAKAKQLFKDKNIDVQMATVSHNNCKYD